MTTKVKSVRKFAHIAIGSTGKIDSYRTPINKIKNVCTIDGTKRGASLSLYTRFITNDKGLIAQVFCNMPISQEQADKYFTAIS